MRETDPSPEPQGRTAETAGQHQTTNAAAQNQTAEPSGQGTTATPPGPDGITTPAEYVAAMRALRLWTGLTYRQLQRNATRNGHNLPHSTIAAVLTRTTLPREETITAFIHACGQDHTTAEHWLHTRRRIAAATTLGPRPTVQTNASPATTAQADAPSAAQTHLPAATTPPPPPAASEPPDTPGGTGDQPAPVVAPDDQVEVTSVPGPDRPEQSGTGDREMMVGETVRPGRDSSPDRATEETEQRASAVPVPVAVAPEATVSVPVPFASGRLAAATRHQRRNEWVGQHRYDPADDVPKPAGLRWLVPPIMYRTGWATRVLTAGLVVLILLAGAATAFRTLREHGTGGAEAGGRPTDPSANPTDILPIASPGPDDTAGPAPSSTAAGPVSPTVRPRPSTSSRVTPRPSRTPGTPPPGNAPPPSRPYLTASATANCRGGGEWSVSITADLHNLSVAYDPHGFVRVDDGTMTGWPIDGDGGSHFSGVVPKFYPGDKVTGPSTDWQVVAYANSDMTGTEVRAGGTISRPSGC